MLSHPVNKADIFKEQLLALSIPEYFIDEVALNRIKLIRESQLIAPAFPKARGLKFVGLYEHTFQHEGKTYFQYYFFIGDKPLELIHLSPTKMKIEGQLLERLMEKCRKLFDI